MTTRILYSQTTQLGKMLAEAVGNAIAARYEMKRVLGILNSSSSGSDWTSLAAEIGGGISVADAQNLWTIFATAEGVIDVAQFDELARLDQG